MHKNILTITTQNKFEADEIIYSFAIELKEKGYRIKGLVQKPMINYNSLIKPKNMMIIDIENNIEYPISQELGKLSTECTLDENKLNIASNYTLNNINKDNTDLVFINRFGKAEANQKGFYNDILKIMQNKIPLVITVNSKYLDIWLSIVEDYTNIIYDNYYYNLLKWWKEFAKNI